MIAILFRCGHPMRVDPDKVMSPRCHCGEVRVARTVGAAPPRFRGTVSGPHAQTQALDPIAVSVAKEPLPLKDVSDAR